MAADDASADKPTIRPAQTTFAVDGLWLVVLGETRFDRHALPETGTIVIGRSPECDLQIDQPSVSRRHARLHLGAELAIEDLDSANGTRVGDRSVAPRTRAEVSEGDVLTFGSTTALIQRRAARVRPRSTSGSAAAIVRDPAMVELYELVDRVAPGTLSVLILGETGAGKELVAEALHRRSPRAQAPLLRLSCAALTDSLLESELFGHERGAFTGAAAAKPGLLENAGRGTVFLDEIGELSMSLQVKLLRVLEERQVTRVGGLEPRRIDARFVAATNRDLEGEVARGTFREDLYYRLAGVTLTISPLRARCSEIAALARHFAQLSCAQLERDDPPDVSAAAVALLESYQWPGNVRELRNVIERAVLLCQGDVIGPEHLPVDRLGEPRMQATAGRSPELPAVGWWQPDAAARERERILAALEAADGNQTRAAELLNISRRTLLHRLDQHEIPRPRKGRKPRGV